MLGKKILVLLSGLYLFSVLSGCCTDDKGLVVTTGRGRQLAFSVTVHDERERYPWWAFLIPYRGKAELYIKVFDEEDKSGVYWLYPVNVQGNESGTKIRKFTLPYVYDSNNPTVLCFELLDDDHMSAEEEKLLVDAVKAGNGIIANGTAAYCFARGYAALAKAILEGAKSVDKLNETAIRALKVKLDEHKFDSLGVRKYKLYHKSGVLLVNPVTIIDDRNKARCDIEIYCVPEDRKGGLIRL